MIITHKSDAINRKRDDGTEISYYIFHEYEVHYGELPPGITQPWHHHNAISETLFIVSGNVRVHYLDGDRKVEQDLVPGDVIEVEATSHTFSNPFTEVCKMVAFRFVPQHVDQRENIKNDKVLHPELEK